MTFAEFQSWALAQGTVAKYNDGQYPGECVSLVNQYCYRVLNVPAGSWGDAYQWGLTSNANVQRYFNIVTDLQVGDIVVYPAGWHGSAPGHIGMYAGNNQILEQNGHVPKKVSLSKLEPGYYAILRSKGAPAQGADKMDREAVRLAFVMTLRRNPGEADYNNNVGRPAADVLNDLQNSQEYKDRTAEWEAGKDDSDGAVLAPGKYVVK